MKKLLLVLVVLVVLATSFTVAFAAPPVSYTSGFALQNLSATTANVVIDFYDQSGVLVNSIPDTVNANSSKTYFPLNGVQVGFDGSAVVSSDQQVAAIINVLGNNGQRGDSYAGFSSGAQTVNLPLIFKATYGFDTWFNVQNTGSADAVVNVTYTGSVVGNPAVVTCTEPATTIKPGAAHTFKQVDNACLPANFVGAATITSGQNIVAILMQVGTDALMAYNGFSTASTNPVMPLITANNYGNYTGIQIMNTGASNSDVTVSYTPSMAGTACTEQLTVAHGQSARFGYPMPAACGSKFIGSAKVTANTASMPLVAIVNQINTGNGNASAYNALNDADAKQTVSLPMIMDRNYGWFTGISVVNMGTAATDISCTFTNSTHTASATAVAPGAALIDVQANVMNSAGSYVGAATCAASAGGKIAAIVNEVKTGGTHDDVLMTYPGYGY